MKILKFLIILFLIPQVCFGAAASRSFNGSTDDASTAANTVRPTNNTITITAWVRVDNWGATGDADQDIIVRSGTVNNNITSNYGLEFNRALRDSNAHRDLCFMGNEVDNPTTVVCYSGTGSTIDLDEWNHICATHQSADRKIYVNGTEVASTTASLTAQTNNTQPMNVGGRNDSNADVIDAELVHVQVYDTYFTEADCKENMWSPKSHPANLLVWLNEDLKDIGPSRFTVTQSGVTDSADGPSVFYSWGPN